MSESNPAKQPVPPTASTEGLPEYEPLTPEMVEDEAIRGDFVMKWAGILLAVLFGCTVIAETSTLLHVKTGQYLAGHGFLPPANDVFSYTAADRPWVNLSWLFDLLSSVAFGIGSFIGLSVFKAVLAGITFGLLAHTSKPGISTWWGSICAILAVLACQPRFTAQPEVVTLIGVAAILWLLHGWLWNAGSRKIWLLIPVCILWSNLDGRAWWGPFLMLLYGIGEFLGKQVGHPGVESASKRATLWIAIAGCWIGLLVNPFLWHSWLAPGVQFGVYYPILLEFSAHRFDAQSLTRALPWVSHPVVMASATVLFVTAGVLMIINRRRLDFGHVLMYFGAAVPAILASHELAAASIVFCVIATLNGQAWYAATNTRRYSTESSALLFSRGGRAVTVLVLFTLALLFTVGRLRPSATGQVGLGLDPDLEGLIQSYETVLKDSIDDQPFHFTSDQGDVLIWLGYKSFIDQRLVVYSGPKDSSILSLYHRLRVALTPTKQGVRQTPQDVKFWKQEFDRLKITHCLPRLGGIVAPDYTTLGDLLNSRDWQLTRLGSATAVFYRLDLKRPELQAYLAKNKFDFANSVFRTESELLSPRGGWAQLPTFYQRYIWQTGNSTSPEVREARHLVGLAGEFGPVGVGMIYLAIRRAQEGLAKNPNDAVAYDILGQAYTRLMSFDSQGLTNSPLAQLRYRQAVEAYSLELVAAPDSPDTHYRLYQLYSIHNRADLALREITAFYNWLSSQRVTDPELENAQVQQLNSAGKDMDRLAKYLKQMEDQAQKLPKEIREQKIQLALFYFRNGMSLKALEILQPPTDDAPQPPQEMSFRAELLMDVGRVEEAYDLAGQLEGYAQQVQIPGWQQLRALTLLANAEYTLAAKIWTDQARDEERLAAGQVLNALIPRHLGAMGRPWPLTVTEPAEQFFYNAPQSTSELNLHSAMIYLEAGQVKRAAEYFRLVLKQNPNHPHRSLVAFYLEKLTGQWLDPIPPLDRMPIEFAAEK